MPVNITTAGDAWLEGKATFEEWRQKFEAEWFDPLGASLWGMLVSRMAPEELTALAQMNPQGYAAIERIIGGGQYAKS